MIGITIGIGEGWNHVAVRAAAQMEKMTGIYCEAITEWPFQQPVHPSWLKCHLMEHYPAAHDFLIFDADIFCLRPWKPAELFEALGKRFCAVPDRNNTDVYHECAGFNLPFPDWYVNGGLLMFSREHAPVWEAVWKRHPRYGSWLEQTALNEALFKLKVDVARLPRLFNQLPNGETVEAMDARGVINFHFADQAGNPARIIELQKELFK